MCTLRESCGVSVSLQLFSANYIQLSFQCNYVYGVVVSISISITMDFIKLPTRNHYVHTFKDFHVVLGAPEERKFDYVDLKLYPENPMLSHSFELSPFPKRITNRAA